MTVRFNIRLGLWQKLPTLYVPHLDRLIITSTDQGLSIGTERYTLNSFCIASEGGLDMQHQEIA
jgi:hypothetical protein